MIGVKSKFKDGNGKAIYSGQRLWLKNPEPGELNLSFLVYWNKDIGFRFRGQMITEFIADKYVICEDILWIQKILPKCV